MKFPTAVLLFICWGQSTCKETCRIEFEEVSVVKQVPTYKKHCHVVEDTKCKTVFKNAFETSLETQCEPTFETSCEPVIETAYEQKCTTITDQECRIVHVEHMGHHTEKTICKDVPQEKCVPVPVKIQGEKCVNVPTQSCSNVPVVSPVEVPKQECWKKPRKVCQTLVTLKPKVVIEKIPKEVCDSDHSSHSATGTEKTVFNFQDNKKKFIDFPKQERKPVQNLVPVNTPQAQQQNQIKINSLNVDTEKNNKIKVDSPFLSESFGNVQKPFLNQEGPKMSSDRFQQFFNVNRFGNLKQNQFVSPPEPQQYKEPQASYENPQTNFENPQSNYENPQPSYENPQPNYENPQTSYENPQTNYEEPKPYYAEEDNFGEFGGEEDMFETKQPEGQVQKKKYGPIAREYSINSLPAFRVPSNRRGYENLPLKSLDEASSNYNMQNKEFRRRSSSPVNESRRSGVVTTIQRLLKPSMAEIASNVNNFTKELQGLKRHVKSFITDNRI